MNDKICLACKNFCFDGGSRGYSTLTPGSPMNVYCNKGHWDVSEDDSQADFFAKNLTAKTCSDFEPSELAIKHGWQPMTPNPSPSAVTGGVTLLPCPCGAMVDEDECPYPHNRESTLWKIQCVNGDCGWFAIGNSADDVIRQWSRRAPLATGNLDYQRTEQFANGLPAALSAQPAKGVDALSVLREVSDALQAAWIARTLPASVIPGALVRKMQDVLSATHDLG